MFSLTYPSLFLSFFQRPCFLSNLSSTFAAAAAVAPADHVKLFLESSKTDVYREGRDVLISKTNTHTCPVNMLLRYFYLAKIPADSTQILETLHSTEDTNMQL
jgi:hypothetical protein